MRHLVIRHRKHLRIAGVFDVSKHFKLGVGAFTDFSQTADLISLGDQEIDFFGANIGFLFSTTDTRPGAERSEADKSKAPVALAIGIRYSHGRGNTLGAFLPSNYDPNAVTLRPVATKINDIDLNVGVKVLAIEAGKTILLDQLANGLRVRRFDQLDGILGQPFLGAASQQGVDQGAVGFGDRIAPA